MNHINTHWVNDAVFYHIYPLGFCGAPARNDFSKSPVKRLEKISQWLPHIQSLGVNALYLGPLFESSVHGYDTADYFKVDRRLGTNQDLKHLSNEMHEKGMRLILDGVFNHVGRDFWAFRDLQQKGEASFYRDWFDGLRFGDTSPYGDAFNYQPWEGHYDLVRLNLHNADVRAHIFEAVRMWIEEFNIDGLRLDVAYLLDEDFLRELSTFCRSLRSDFWLLGEVVHGDYRRWANNEMLDSVTNYEAHKGLYSSLVDKNCFEIAYALKRQSAAGGLYAHLVLYNFADNHDVNRVASNLSNPDYLNPLYLLLFSMPGVPSIYYGSEWGIPGRRTSEDDSELRPCLELEEIQQSAPQSDLPQLIARLSALRANHPALRYGSYEQLHVANEQLAFLRRCDDEILVILLNASDTPAAFEFHLPFNAASAVDLLNNDQHLEIKGNQLTIEHVQPRWGRILKISQ